MEYLIRTRLTKDILAEVAFPERHQGKVALVCGGAPGTPPSKKVLNFLADKGYIAFGIRYRGTWESEGNFLASSPAKDVADIIEYLVKQRSIIDALEGKRITLKVKSFDLFGGSFGGPAVLLNSKNKYVKKVIAICPVVDFQKTGVGESFEDFVQFTKEGFGGAYRVKSKNEWRKLLRKDFYNPLTMVGDIDPKKCFVIQTLDDDVCPPENTKDLETLIPVNVYYKPKGGHLGIGNISQKFFWKKIEKFLKK